MKKYTQEEIIELITQVVAESHDWSAENNDIHSIGIIEKRFLNDWIERNVTNIEEKTETTIPFTFRYLSMHIEWEILCELIGVDYYKKEYVSEKEVFDIKESDVKKYKLIG